MHLTDPRAIRALAHPLRLDLLELLGGISPATAARCAEVLGVSHASASYHLRQLAKYGFVEEGEPSADQRERPWRIVSRSQVPVTGPGPATDELSRVSVEREATKILEWIDRRGTEPPDWQEAAFLIGGTLPMTSQELATVSRQIAAVLEPYRDRVSDSGRPTLPPGGRWVRLHLAGTPYPELDLPELDPTATPEGVPDDRPDH